MGPDARHRPGGDSGGVGNDQAGGQVTTESTCQARRFRVRPVGPDLAVLPATTAATALDAETFAHRLIEAGASVAVVTLEHGAVRR